nr:serine/threonine-protein kinase [Petrachloros mirabilis]
MFCIQCGIPLKTQRQVRQYQILRILGKGGMGTTALAWTPATADSPSRLQVLKELNEEMIPVPKARELFQREGRILKTLNHDNIPAVYDAFAEGDRLYLVMEMIQGRSLAQWVSRNGPAPPTQAIDWMLQVCEVLTYLHGRQPPIIHRDLKPSNLLIRVRDRKICVIDFGVVKEFSPTPGTYIAAEGYSPPEQRLGNPTPQSDLYAAGATLVYLLTGQHPGEFHINLDLGYRIDVSTISLIPAPLRAVIAQATSPQPSQRFASAEELALALQDCLDGLRSYQGRG